MYLFLDILLTSVHLVIILFNLFGWLWRRTQRLHLVVAGLTAASWLLLGIWFGLGYCPVTDWQWQVKEKLGERNLPASFIQYWLNTVWGFDLPTPLIDACTAGGFAVAVICSVWVNRRRTVA